MSRICLLLIFLCVFIHNGNTANPTGCTDDSTDSSVTHYFCDFQTTGSSVSFAGFTDSQPQRLTVYNVDNTRTVASSYFSGFSAFSTLNEDFPATLEINCDSTASVTFGSGAFTDFGYMEEMVLNDCATSLIASMFSGIGTVNKLSIKGGTLTTLDPGTMTSLDISPITTVDDPRGELRIQNVVLTPGTFPANFFAPLTNVTSIYLVNVGLTTVDSTWFQANTALVYLSLANNQITTLPSTVFDTNLGLMYLNLAADPLNCSDTSEVWYYSYALTNNITFVGSAICETPSSEQNKSLPVWASQFTTVTDPCDGETGVVVSGNCIGLFKLISYIFTFVCLVLGITSLILVNYLRRSTLRAKQANITRDKPDQKQEKEKEKGPRRNSNAWT